MRGYVPGSYVFRDGLEARRSPADGLWEGRKIYTKYAKSSDHSLT